ncbi:MAG TPA: M23 family metallopeptidase [Rubricoccaceae bacterium]|nr:M23 family metallopeptidase [Rubricoccaceae bacterium]
MPRNRFYYYDHEACTFVEVQPDRTRLLKQGGAVAAIAFAFVAVGIWFGARNVTTPTELAQRDEIEALRDQLMAANERLSTYSEDLEALAATDREIYRTVLNAEPISEDEFRAGVGGARTTEAFDRFSVPTARLLRQTSETLERLDRQFTLQSRSFDDLREIARARQEELREQPAILPIRNARLTSGFGMRYHPILHVTRMHAGVDFPAPIGTPVYATGDGVVAFAGTMSGYGNVLEISHPLVSRRTRYAHLSRVAEGVRPGAPVRRGQVVAYTGNTGLSTAPHLHYEVRQVRGNEAVPINPISTFVPGVTNREYQELVQHARRETVSFD